MDFTTGTTDMNLLVKDTLKRVGAWIRKPVSIWCDHHLPHALQHRLWIVGRGMLYQSSSMAVRSCWTLPQKLRHLWHCVCVRKLHILEFHFIVPSTSYTCVMIMLFNQLTDMPHLSVAWIILAEEKCSLTFNI